MAKVEPLTRQQETGTPLNDLLQKPVRTTAFSVLLDPPQHDQMARAASTFSKSTVLPGHWRSKPENVFTALCRAYSLNIDPLMFLENSFEVSGKIGMSSQLQIALANNSGRLADPIDWVVEGEGQTLSVTAYAKLVSGKEIRATVTMKQAKADGWTKNKKYESMPEEMLMWRSASWLIRRYMPEVVLGMYTADELQDAQYSEQASKTPPPKQEKPDTGPELMSEQQNKWIHSLIADAALDREAFKKANGIESMTQVTKDQFSGLIFAALEDGISNADSVERLQMLNAHLKQWAEGNPPECEVMRQAYADKMRELANAKRGGDE